MWLSGLLLVSSYKIVECWRFLASKSLTEPPSLAVANCSLEDSILENAIEFTHSSWAMSWVFKLQLTENLLTSTPYSMFQMEQVESMQLVPIYSGLDSNQSKQVKGEHWTVPLYGFWKQNLHMWNFAWRTYTCHCGLVRSCLRVTIIFEYF